MHDQRILISTCFILLLALASPAGDCLAADWPVFGRDHTRNAVSPETDPPTDWDVETGRNIKWTARLGYGAYGTPSVADGLLWVGGNNYDRANRDAKNNAALLNCFDARTGELLYQYESPRLDGGHFHDPEWVAMFSTPLVEGDRLWFISNRHEVICMNIAPLKAHPRSDPEIVWKVDMIEQYGIHPHTSMMCPRHQSCIPTSYDGLIFVTTNNAVAGIDKTAAPDAPGLICFDSRTGDVLWTKRTGANVLMAEMASPLVAEISGRGQVVVPHGDGWVRSYDPPTGELLWEFDANPKTSRWTIRGRTNGRDYFVASPVLYEDRIYIAKGRTSDNSWGPGQLVCIDTSMQGDRVR